VNEKPLIAILTDFGTSDPFVGIMKGVIAKIAPGAKQVDITQEIPPGDIFLAALHLWQAYAYFPQGAIFLCVVDPGVGTSRRGMILESGDYVFVGPDNGLFTFVTQENTHAWELSNPKYALPKSSSTFHGRDLFAPAAAHAALGVQGSEFGQEIHKPIQLPRPRLDYQPPGIIRGEILHVDRFGNLLTSLGQFKRGEGGLRFDPWLRGGEDKNTVRQFPIQDAVLEIQGGSQLTWVETFGQVPAGQCAFLVGSSGLVEIVANRTSAQEELGLQRGGTITLKAQGAPHG
jgi:S-adenosylmethionine hydrolase